MDERKRYGFVRVGTSSISTKVAHVSHNVGQHLQVLEDAEAKAIDVLFFPELGLTGYSCGVLFQQESLQEAALAGLITLKEESRRIFQGAIVIGAPLAVDSALFNCAIVINRGEILGIVPKSYLPNYKEFVEERWFADAGLLRRKTIRVDRQEVPVGSDLLFEADELSKLVLGVEVCEDCWVPISPGDIMSASGATLIGNISASDELVGKADWRRTLILGKCGAAISAYAYTSAGPTESTTDLVFGGHCLIAENGTLLKESARFVRGNNLTYADIDVERLVHDRQLSNSFQDNLRTAGMQKEFRRQKLTLRAPWRSALLSPRHTDLARITDHTPFVPGEPARLHSRCADIFNIQVNGLASRLEAIGLDKAVIGVSGGLDSTHALTVTCKTFDQLGYSRKNIHGFTLPGFGTTERTRQNALKLMESLEVRQQTVDIRAMCLLEMQSTGYKPFGIDIADLSVEQFTKALQAVPTSATDLRFENVQARMRTSILMNEGFVIGTGDLSELALGWCTFNADHMSMYGINASVPKTLIKFLVKWTADNHFEGAARKTMLDIFNTEISPELLPLGSDGKVTQKTEESVGPYELNDFFLYYLARFGMTAEKIFYLAKQARFTTGDYSDREILHWLDLFLQRFFHQQYKRSTLPDGPKVGTITLSPRAEWLMPSDAHPDSWLEWLKQAQALLAKSSLHPLSK